jgi:RsiW-degrading membrane proteinase PrsW (M82 family)|tara:strand:- start:1165 stop:1791 length:627 start_codon:yes stop_codon:yes gene_type:complete
MNSTLILTLAPPLLIVAYIIKADRFPEPVGLCISTFLLGCLLCIPAASLNSYFIPDLSYAYLAGFTEETLKFAAIYFYIRTKTDFDEPMDAIVYGTLISLGFATLENFQYVYNAGNPDFIAILRSFTAIPLHACCGIIMGYYFGLYIFKERDKLNLIKSLFFAIAFHASYNYFATRNILLMFVVLIILVMFAKKLHKLLKAEQMLKLS